MKILVFMLTMLFSTSVFAADYWSCMQTGYYGKTPTVVLSGPMRTKMPEEAPRKFMAQVMKKYKLVGFYAPQCAVYKTEKEMMVHFGVMVLHANKMGIMVQPLEFKPEVKKKDEAPTTQSL